MTREVMEQALEALENAVRYHGIMLMSDPPQDAWKYHRVQDNAKQAITALREALAQPEQEPVLQEIEQYRMQMAGISTAAIGYWKVGDGIHPDYDTVALRDVAKLYAKYDELYKLKEQS